MLRFAEEIMLLLLDDRDGSFLPIPEWSMQCALAGAVLMDLALEDRIDTDLESLILVDKKPTGDPLLDPTLERIAASSDVHGARYWVENTASYAEEIREGALARLVDSGVLNREEDRFLWSSGRGATPPSTAGRSRKSSSGSWVCCCRTRFGPPGHRHHLPVRFLRHLQRIAVFPELERARGRIDQVRKLDLIGQAVSKSVWEIQASLAMAAHPVY